MTNKEKIFFLYRSLPYWLEPTIEFFAVYIICESDIIHLYFQVEPNSMEELRDGECLLAVQDLDEIIHHKNLEDELVFYHTISSSPPSNKKIYPLFSFYENLSKSDTLFIDFEKDLDDVLFVDINQLLVGRIVRNTRIIRMYIDREHVEFTILHEGEHSIQKLLLDEVILALKRKYKYTFEVIYRRFEGNIANYLWISPSKPIYIRHEKI